MDLLAFCSMCKNLIPCYFFLDWKCMLKNEKSHSFREQTKDSHRQSTFIEIRIDRLFEWLLWKISSRCNTLNQIAYTIKFDQFGILPPTKQIAKAFLLGKKYKIDQNSHTHELITSKHSRQSTTPRDSPLTIWNNFNRFHVTETWKMQFLDFEK